MLVATLAMTDDTILPFSFPAVSRKKITAASDGGRLTSNGGVMLLAMADRRVGVAEKLSLVFPERRDATRSEAVARASPTAENVPAVTPGRHE